MKTTDRRLDRLAAALSSDNQGVVHLAELDHLSNHREAGEEAQTGIADVKVQARARQREVAVDQRCNRRLQVVLAHRSADQVVRELTCGRRGRRGKGKDGGRDGWAERAGGEKVGTTGGAQLG